MIKEKSNTCEMILFENSVQLINVVSSVDFIQNAYFIDWKLLNKLTMDC